MFLHRILMYISAPYIVFIFGKLKYFWLIYFIVKKLHAGDPFHVETSPLIRERVNENLLKIHFHRFTVAAL